MKNVFKTMMVVATFLIAGCGPENTVSVSEATFKKLENGGYQVLIDLDCVGGLGSDECTGSEVCILTQFENEQDEILESVQRCKNLSGIGITTFKTGFENPLADAASFTFAVELKNAELGISERDQETTIFLNQ